MPETNDTCRVCGGTWGEPWRIAVHGDRSLEDWIPCPADCHDQAKWAALAGLIARIADLEHAVRCAK